MIDASPSSAATSHPTRRRWPWIALLALSGVFWFVNWLLELSTCVDHGVNTSYDPESVAVEPGPVPHTLAITADAPTDRDSPPVRQRLGLYRIGFAGRLIPVAPSPPAP